MPLRHYIEGLQLPRNINLPPLLRFQIKYKGNDNNVHIKQGRSPGQHEKCLQQLLTVLNQQYRTLLLESNMTYLSTNELIVPAECAVKGIATLGLSILSEIRVGS